ncbi:MAG: M20/M25/M40 family metallo-hydrolase [Gemmatimonadota bacterium]
MTSSAVSPRTAIVFTVLLTACQGAPAAEGPGAPAGQVAADTVIQQQYVEEIAGLATDPRVQQAFQVIQDLEPRTMEDLVTLTEIPAPPFQETERGLRFLQMLRDAGADTTFVDDEGNVIGIRRGTASGPAMVLSGHLDTVFPEGTDVTVRMRGDTLYAPGVGDDTRGLMVVLTVLRAMDAANIRTVNDVWFVGTVGEEGLGDLRGVKHLFREGGPEIDAFISIDGGNIGRIVNQALGSRRYRATFNGPGGHSWGAFGLGNPAHALGRAIRIFDERAAEYVSEGPRTSYNVGVIGGGTSVNAIPFEAWMQVDMRSEDPERLAGIDELFQQSAQQAVAEQNERREGGEPLSVDLEVIGDRPSGDIAPATPLVQRAMATARHFGEEPSLSRSSTDSNTPISLGIPAVTLGRGGAGGNSHALDEWWLNRDGHLAIQSTLLVVLAQAGIARE